MFNKNEKRLIALFTEEFKSTSSETLGTVLTAFDVLHTAVCNGTELDLAEEWNRDSIGEVVAALTEVWANKTEEEGR